MFGEEPAAAPEVAPSPASVERDLAAMAEQFNKQPIVATPDELARMIEAQKAKIVEAEKRARETDYRVRQGALDALPGLKEGLAELEQRAGIEKPKPPETGDLLAERPEPIFDKYAEQHLDKWLEDTIPEEQRATLKSRIVDLLADHPDMMERGWDRLRDIVEGPTMAPIIGPRSPSPKPQIVDETVIETVPNPNPNWSDIRLVKRQKDNGDIFYSVLYDSKIDSTRHGRAFATEEEARKFRDGMVKHEQEQMTALKAIDEKAAAEGKATRAQRQAAFRFIERQRNKGWSRGNFAQAYWDFLQGERDAPDSTGVGPVVKWDIIAKLTEIAGKPAPSKAEAARDAFNARKKGQAVSGPRPAEIRLRPEDIQAELVAGGSAGRNIPTAERDAPSFTIKATPKEPVRAVINGITYRLNARALARLQGLPDSYPLPDNEALARTIIGNGVPPPLMRAVVGPLIQANASSGKTPRGITLFSGGGLAEVGLDGMVHFVAAVEMNPEIAAHHQQAHGTPVTVGKVQDVDYRQWEGVDYLHASPVCKSFSVANAQKGEVSLDLSSADATIRAIKDAKPRIVTIENVPNYEGSESLTRILTALSDEGYQYDVAVYDAADYGVPQHRKRLLVRAVKDGELPPRPQPTGSTLGWFDAVHDLTLPVDSAGLAPWQRERLDRQRKGSQR